MDLAHLFRLFATFFLDVFLLGFCQHLLLPAVVLVTVLILTGNLAQGYGLDRLVRHKCQGKQFVVGLAFGVLLIKTLFVGYLIETTRLGGPHSLVAILKQDAPHWLACRVWVYLAGVVGSFIVAVVALWCIVAAINVLVSRSGRSHVAGTISEQAASVPAARARSTVPVWPLVLGLAVGLAGFALSIWAAQSFEPLERGLSWLGRLVFDETKVVPPRETFHLDGGAHRESDAGYAALSADMALHGMALCSTLLALVFYAIIVPSLRERFSPIVAGCFLLDLLVAVVGWLAIFLPGVAPFLIVLVLFLATMGGLSRYRVRFPNLDYGKLQPLAAYTEPLPLTGLTPTEPAAQPFSSTAPYLLTSATIPWSPASQPRPLVLVCASGGGIRAAAWTLAVLEQLEFEFAKKDVAFPYHVRLVTGASGGMVGAAYYVSTLAAPDSQRSGQVNRSGGVTLADMFTNVCKDSLSPLVFQMIYEDLPKVCCPVPFGKDRGMVLEETWKTNLDGALDCSFASLREGEAAGWRPSLIFSPMMIEDGRRLLFSNLNLDGVTENKGNVLLDSNKVYSREALEFFRLFPDATDSFKVSTATRMSASFPYFSPAGVLPTWPRRRVVDAGYYDNYGVSLAAAWLFRNSGWVQKNASRVLLIQIRDSVSEQARMQPSTTDDSSVLGRGLEGITSPPDGLFSSREWSMSFRNDEQLRVLTDYFDRSVGDLYFTTVAFEYKGDASLSWYLSDEEQASIRDDAQLIPGSKNMEHLFEWWFRATGKPTMPKV